MTNSQSTAQPSTVRHLNTPAAAALADLVGVFEDLQTVLRCCERLMLELASAPAEPDDLLVEALWTTAVMSYSRCFSPGKRGMGLTGDDVKELPLKGEVLEWHRVLRDLRKHYADPTVNPRERFSVGVSQDPTGAPNGIAITSTRQPLVDDLTVRQTGAIAYELSQLVDKRIAEQQDVIFKSTKSMNKVDLDKLPLVDVVEDDGFVE